MALRLERSQPTQAPAQDELNDRVINVVHVVSTASVVRIAVEHLGGLRR